MERSGSDWEDIRYTDEATKLDLHGRVLRSVNAPLAVIMGWVGSKERNLRKYAHMYKDLGYSVVWLSAPLSTLATRESRQRYVQVLCNIIVPFADGGVILCPFSNGGAFLVREMWEMGGDNFRRLRDKVCATCFDSCPAYIGLFTGARAILQGYDEGHSALATWVSAHCWNLYLVGAGVLGSGSVDGGFWNAMNSLWFGENYGELFVFSEEDPACSAEKVKEFIEARPRRPQVLRFSKCGHCLHGLKFPKEYAAALKKLHQEVVDPWRAKHGRSALGSTRRAMM